MKSRGTYRDSLFALLPSLAIPPTLLKYSIRVTCSNWWVYTNAPLSSKDHSFYYSLPLVLYISWDWQMCRDQFDKQGFWKPDMVREWEMRHKDSEKSEDQGTNTAPRWMCWNWIQVSFIILSAVNERISGVLNYNSCGL